MKVAIVILVIAIVGAFAQDTTTVAGPPPFVCDGNAFICKFKELGHHIKYHASKLGDRLSKVGTSVLGAALDQGKSLLTNGAQAVLGTVLEHLNKEGIVGKREVTLISQIKDHIRSGFELAKNAKNMIHTAFKTAVSKLTGIIQKNAALEKVDQAADKKIDAAIDEYKKSGKAGFLEMAKAISGKLRDIFAAGMNALKTKWATAKKVDERAILGFSSITDAWNKAKEHLKGVASGIADTFRPHIENLKNGIAALGAKAKEHAGNLVDAAKGSFNDLKTKLSGHIDTLKGHAGTLGTHATNAINALKEAVASIALQAVGNAKDTIGDIVKTGTDAAGTVAGHVSGAVGF